MVVAPLMVASVATPTPAEMSAAEATTTTKTTTTAAAVAPWPLTDDRFLVVCSNVMPPDAILVEVVQDGEIKLLPILTVVRLRVASAVGRRGVRGGEKV